MKGRGRWAPDKADALPRARHVILVLCVRGADPAKRVCGVPSEVHPAGAPIVCARFRIASGGYHETPPVVYHSRCDRRWGLYQTAHAPPSYSCRTTLSRELLILRPPLYSMKPSFLNLFMKKFTRDRVVPIISASVSCEIFGSTRCGLSSLP